MLVAGAVFFGLQSPSKAQNTSGAAYLSNNLYVETEAYMQNNCLAADSYFTYGNAATSFMGQVTFMQVSTDPDGTKHSVIRGFGYYNWVQPVLIEEHYTQRKNGALSISFVAVDAASKATIYSTGFLPSGQPVELNTTWQHFVISPPPVAVKVTATKTH